MCCSLHHLPVITPNTPSPLLSTEFLPPPFQDPDHRKQQPLTRTVAMPTPASGVEAVDAVAPSPSHAPVSFQDVKAVELRQLHAALLQHGAPNARAACRSPAVIRLPPVASPARSRTSEGGYPVFTPVSEPSRACVGCTCGLR
jgi:hypothetical protein